MYLLNDKEQIRFRFAVVSDGHYGEKNVPSDAQYCNLVSWLNHERRTRGLDLWVFNGDLIHDNPDHLKKVKQYMDSTEVEYFTVKGNHDLVSDDIWKSFFNHPANDAIVRNDIVFLYANTSDSVGNYLCADTQWLSDSLRKYYDFKYIFVFLHISQGGWTTHGIHCPEVIRIFDDFPGITAVFHGHDHQEDHMKQSGNTRYFFDGYIGGSWGSEYQGYRIVEIYHDRKVLTYQYNPEARKIMNIDYIYDIEN